MTKPRRHIAGQVAMLTRRCSERRYFLRPDDYINQVLPYETAKAAGHHGQHVYGAMAMSNHVHFCLGDTTGNRSDFMQEAMSGIARSRNNNLGRSGHFWGTGSYNDTVLLDVDAIERKLLYTWLNPVQAGLVERAEDWPGFKILPRHWGETIRIEQPDQFYGRGTPDAVEFVPQPPPGYDDMSLEEVKQHFQRLLKIAEDEIAALRRERNESCAGAANVRSRKPHDRPKEPEPNSGINPRFATTDPELMVSAINTYRSFLNRYETRRQRWLGGKRVTFPCGTVALKRRAPITCDSPADDEPGLFATG